MSRTTQDPGHVTPLAPTGLSPPAAGLPRPFGFRSQRLRRSFNPAVRKRRFGLIRFRSPLLAESFPLLGLLRCFTSPGSPPVATQGDAPLRAPGFPIRIPPANCGCTRLTRVFRSVPRPSSAPDAKASTKCPSAPVHVIRRNCCSRVTSPCTCQTAPPPVTRGEQNYPCPPLRCQAPSAPAHAPQAKETPPRRLPSPAKPQGSQASLSPAFRSPAPAPLPVCPASPAWDDEWRWCKS